MTAGTNKPRIVLADDHQLMLDKIAHLLQRDFEIVAIVQTGRMAVQAVTELKPDVVVLDIAMPELGGIEAAREIRKIGSSARIVFLSIQDDPEYIEAASAMGIGYVLKSRMRSDLAEAIREALAGRLFVSDSRAS